MRSLTLPPGLRLSSLAHRCARIPSRARRRASSTSGVPPSVASTPGRILSDGVVLDKDLCLLQVDEHAIARLEAHRLDLILGHLNDERLAVGQKDMHLDRPP